MMTPMPDAPTDSTCVVLVSGGLDSAVCLASVIHSGADVIGLTFDYGQRHRIELDAARRVCAAGGVRDRVVLEIDLRSIGASALTGDFEVPKRRDDAAISRDIPITYVPARNLIFLSCAAALAEARGASEVCIGVNAIDYSGYPDCRPEFIESFEHTARLATRVGVESDAIRVRTPLKNLTKPDIVRLGVELGVDFALTHSCYDPDEQGRACGGCDACILRRRGFEEANVADPTVYRDGS